MNQLVLSLFPGIGMLDQAFEEHGFCVVRGPDVLWGGDIRRFSPPPRRFDGVIGGPPCQMFSRLAHMVRHNGYKPRFGNLIPEFERCVAAAVPKWFLMENVPDAPVPAVSGYGIHAFTLNNRELGEKQNRIRRWSFGWRGGRKVLKVETVCFENPDMLYCEGEDETRSKRTKMGRMPWNHKGIRGFEMSRRAQGLPDDFDLPPFKVAEKCRAVRNGVPIAMGRAMAKAVKAALGLA